MSKTPPYKTPPTIGVNYVHSCPVYDNPQRRRAVFLSVITLAAAIAVVGVVAARGNKPADNSPNPQ